jgi:hypothetical protein
MQSKLLSHEIVFSAFNKRDSRTNPVIVKMLFYKNKTYFLEKTYGAQIPLILQLFVLGHPVIVKQSPTVMHEQFTDAALADVGATSDATRGKATIEVKPTFLTIRVWSIRQNDRLFHRRFRVDCLS